MVMPVWDFLPCLDGPLFIHVDVDEYPSNDLDQNQTYRFPITVVRTAQCEYGAYLTGPTSSCNRPVFSSALWMMKRSRSQGVKRRSQGLGKLLVWEQREVPCWHRSVGVLQASYWLELWRISSIYGLWRVSVFYVEDIILIYKFQIALPLLLPI